MLEFILIGLVLGGAVGSTAAYGLIRRQVEQIHFCSAENLPNELERFKIRVIGNEKCIVCQDEIRPDTIGMVVERDGKYYEVCNKDRCMTLSDVVMSHDT